MSVIGPTGPIGGDVAMRTLIARLVVLVLVGAGMVLGSGVPAAACSCPRQPLRAHLQGADAVFVGTVGNLVDGLGYTNVVRVSSVYVGDVPAVVTVNTGQEGLAGSGNSCNVSLRPGRRRLFVASGDGGEYGIGPCSAPGALNEQVTRRLESLAGSAAAPEPAQPIAVPQAVETRAASPVRDNYAGWVVAATVGTLLAGGGLLRWRLRRIGAVRS